MANEMVLMVKIKMSHPTFLTIKTIQPFFNH
jgi:hypothetical protein